MRKRAGIAWKELKIAEGKTRSTTAAKAPGNVEKKELREQIKKRLKDDQERLVFDLSYEVGFIRKRVPQRNALPGISGDQWSVNSDPFHSPIRCSVFFPLARFLFLNYNKPK